MTDSSLASLVNSYLDLRWHFDPVDATWHGVPGHSHRLGVFDEESVQQHIAALRSLENAIEELELEDVDDEIDRTAVLNEIRSTSHELKKHAPWARNPARWLGHAFDALSRGGPDGKLECVEALPAFLEHAEASLSQCPSVFVESALAMIPGGHGLVDQAIADADGDKAEAEAITAHARAAMGSFETMLQNLPPATSEFAVGTDGFEYLLQFRHATNATPRSLWASGVDWIKEAEHDLESHTSTHFPGKPWRDVAASLRGDNPVDSVEVFQDELNRARRVLMDADVLDLPDEPLEVVPTPDYLQPLLPVAGYQQTAGGRPARFLVNLPAVTRQPLGRHAVPVTVAHEALPGHHLQLSAAARLDRPVRRYLSSTVMIEGWAHYGEDLMGELGFFDGPEQVLWHLVARLHRAVRVVLDVGLHTEGMSVDGAVDMLVTVAGADREGAMSEVRRFCQSPTEGLSYTLGKRDLQRLRQQVTGEEDLRAFHRRVLMYGGLPPGLIGWGLGLA